MQELLETGKTPLLTGFVSSRTQRKFKAYLVKNDKGAVGFEFEKKAERPATKSNDADAPTQAQPKPARKKAAAPKAAKAATQTRAKAATAPKSSAKTSSPRTRRKASPESA